MDHYQKDTQGISVGIYPTFQEDQSNPEEDFYLWVYRVSIHNHSHRTIQILHRHWEVVDVAGHVQQIDDRGVAGEQPVLRPEEDFVYLGWTPLAAPSGMMHGYYRVKS